MKVQPAEAESSFTSVRRSLSGTINLDKAIPKEIGAFLKITEGTVKVHIGYVLKKLDASGRAEAVRIALEPGIVHLT